MGYKLLGERPFNSSSEARDFLRGFSSDISTALMESPVEAFSIPEYICLNGGILQTTDSVVQAVRCLDKSGREALEQDLLLISSYLTTVLSVVSKRGTLTPRTEHGRHLRVGLDFTIATIDAVALPPTLSTKN